MTGADDSTIWVMAANAMIWLGIAGYLAFLARRQAILARRVKHVEMMSDDAEA